MSVTIWQILTAIAPVLAPIVSLLLMFVGKVIINHERRIRNLEQSKRRHSRTLYGDDDDLQQQGVSKIIENIYTRIEDSEEDIEDLQSEHQQQE